MFAKERYGRVPIGMQIMITPEVPANEEVNFQREWASIIARAEEALCAVILRHLNRVIEDIDKNILKRINETLEILGVEDNPRDIIRNVLTEVNKERNR